MQKIHLIATGTELLDGRVRDRNAWWLGGWLRDRGALLEATTIVRDTIDDIVRAVELATSSGANLVVVSGGLGPTPDDRTREAIARIAGAPLVRSEDAVERLRGRYRERGRALEPSSLRQADVPRDARRIANPRGTAEGFVVTVDGADVIALPGVPAEFETMLPNALADLVVTTSNDAPNRRALVGMFESEAAERIRAAIGAASNQVTWRVDLPIVEVGLDALCLEDAEDAARAVAAWSLPVGTSHPAEALGALATAQSATISTAESCTGGLVASWITDVPGASKWFHAGYVTYSNTAKSESLRVDPSVIEAHGAVSRDVAVAMARGARERSGSTIGVALTGIAGPTGSTPGKPVGTVWIAAADADGVDVARAWFAGRDRATFKSLAASLAMRMASSMLDRSIDPSRFGGVQEYHRFGEHELRHA